MTRRALTRGALAVLAASGLIGLSLQSAGAAEKWSDVALTGRLAQLYHSLASQPRRGFNSWKALSKARQA